MVFSNGYSLFSCTQELSLFQWILLEMSNGLHWNFPMEFHFCEFWCVTFCPDRGEQRDPDPKDNSLIHVYTCVYIYIYICIYIYIYIRREGGIQRQGAPFYTCSSAFLSRIFVVRVGATLLARHSVVSETISRSSHLTACSCCFSKFQSLNVNFRTFRNHLEMLMKQHVEQFNKYL